MSTTGSSDNPRHSYPGPQTNSAARPRRAYTPEDIPPTTSRHQPTRTNQTTPTNQTHWTTPPPLPDDPQPPGPPPLPPDPINHHRRRTIWIIVVAAIVVIGIVGGIISALPPRTTNPGALTSQPATPPPRSGGLSFTTAAATGYWKITKTQWSDTSVRLNVEITVDTGTLYCAFSALDAAGSPVDPSYVLASDLRPGFVAAGETIVGTLTFNIPRQAMTLVMSDGQQTQLSSLAVPG